MDWFLYDNGLRLERVKVIPWQGKWNNVLKNKQRQNFWRAPFLPVHVQGNAR